MPPHTRSKGDRFSLEDPEAGAQLIERLSRNRVRLTFKEACICFGADVESSLRVRDLLFDLVVQGKLVEIEPNLYCLPEMKKENKAARDKLLKGGGADPVRRKGITKRKEKKDIAPRRLERHDPDRAERWLLRRMRVYGHVVAARETFGAAVRGGGAANDLEAAEALLSLEKLGWVEFRPGRLYILTHAGLCAADEAAAMAKLLGDPPIAFCQPLPDILWVDDA